MKQVFIFLLLAFGTSASAQFIQCYEDNDHDGYGDPNKGHLGTAGFNCQFYGWASNGFDCDDNNPAINPNTIWYKDADDDLYTDGTTKTQCSRPEGYKLSIEVNSLIVFDCDDNDRYVTVIVRDWWPDPDHDGYTVFFGGYISQICRPIGYIAAPEMANPFQDDCNQNDPLERPGQVWYPDLDGDSYPGSTTSTVQCSRPTGYKVVTELISLLILDCDDSDAGTNPSTAWYKDADNDGYYSGTSVMQCYAPSPEYKKTVLGGDDCNDNDPLQHPNQEWYLDGDHDGHGHPDSKVIQCSRPGLHYFTISELVTINDCFDLIPSMHPGASEVCDGMDNNCNGVVDEGVQLVFARDQDGDGAGNLNVTVLACSAPDGYVPFQLPGDCDDDHPGISVPQWYYKDNDHDGYGDPNDAITAFCSLLAPYGYSSNNFDCNDSDPQVHSPKTFYWDDDHDGYGDPNNHITLCSFSPPRGYVGNGNDCDDDNALINPFTIWYKDADNDGYSDGGSQQQCTRPAGYKLSSELTATSGDCNDDNGVLNPGTTWYKDADNDGYSDGSSQTQCTRPTNYKLPSELTATSGDCDDNNSILNPSTTWYKDLDNDGYGDGGTVAQCVGPTGYKLASALIATSGDCNDNNAAINPLTVWYKDADNDGYSDGATVTQCARPANYKLPPELTATSGDCNEANAAVNPGTVLAITAPAAKTVNADAGKCSASNVSLGTPTYSDNCSVLTVTNNAPSVFQVGQTAVIWKVLDAGGHSATSSQTVTVVDNQPPVINNADPDNAMLYPPNHKMKDVMINYTTTDNCGAPTTTLTVSSNEPITGTGDGDVSPDWQVIDNHHVRLRAEKSRGGDGRIYTITITATDAGGNTSTNSVTVRVAHNITSPKSGQSFKVGSTVSLEGEFWDKPGNKHSATWLIDDNTTVKGTVTEPTATRNGKVTGSYKFTAPGIYKLQMNTKDQNNVVSYANTNGDLEAIIVIYDPNGGYAYGGGYFNSPAGAITSNASVTGKASYGFSVNYFKGATYPKGETQFEFKVGEFEFNALNFEYMSIAGAKAQMKGTGKIIGGQSGINFILTVTDGQLDGTGIDRIRMKIYNKNTMQVYYDNQPGASDASNPTTQVQENSTVVISGSSNNNDLTKSNQSTKTVEQEVAPLPDGFQVKATPNPSNTSFRITLNSDNLKEPVKLIITDMLGKVIETRITNTGQIITIGEKYRSGTYVVNVIHGKEKRQLKLIKLPD
jgi:hypothetical protein